MSTADTPGGPMSTQIPVLPPPLDQPPIGGIDDLQQQAHRAHADTALQLATRAAHGQLTTPDKQAAFLAERLTHAREEIVGAATIHTTTPAPHWRPNEAGAHRLPGRRGSVAEVQDPRKNL